MAPDIRNVVTGVSVMHVVRECSDTDISAVNRDLRVRVVVNVAVCSIKWSYNDAFMIKTSTRLDRVCEAGRSRISITILTCLDIFIALQTPMLNSLLKKMRTYYQTA